MLRSLPFVLPIRRTCASWEVAAVAREAGCPVKGLAAALIALALTTTFAAPGRAVVRTYFIAGQVRTTSFDTLPIGTPFAGTYAFDDASVDSNGAADVGSYATGAFFVDLGPTLGTIAFDQSGATTVRDDAAGFFGSLSDTFTIAAGVGARNTPGFNNAIQGLTTMLFRQTTFSPATPTALADDTLTGVPQVAGSPWDVDDQTITLQLSAVGGGCAPFATSCYTGLGITTVAEAFTLTVVKGGLGTGSVTSAPPGIDCGTTCAALMGGTVVLTATPDSRFQVGEWTGCDSVDGAECTVMLTDARTVTVAFDYPEIVPTLGGIGRGLLAALLGALGGGMLWWWQRRR